MKKKKFGNFRRSVRNVGGFENARIAVRIKRVLAESTKEEEQEPGTDGDEGEDISPECMRNRDLDGTKDFRFDISKRNTALRNTDQIVIQHVHAERVGSDDRKVFRIFLQPCLEEDDERNHEVAEQQRDVGDIPVAGVTDQEIRSFLSDVGVPDQEVLREGDVGPERGECEEQLAHDMEMLRTRDVFEMALTFQPSADQDDHRHRVQRGSREKIHTPHGREPFIIQSHHEVETGEGDGQSENDQRVGRVKTSAEKTLHAWIWIGVLIGRKFAQTDNHRTEADGVEKHAAIPERQVHEPVLVVEQMIHVMKVLFHIAMTVTVNVHPLVKILLNLWEKQRDRERHHPREGRTEVLKCPPDGCSPTRVGDVVKQGPEATADGQGQEKVKREQPGVGERTADFFGSEKQQVNADDRADDCDSKGDSFHPRDLGGIEVIAVDGNVCGCDVVGHL